jgi:predicted negative regulator of RcsB-dependent stress response
LSNYTEEQQIEQLKKIWKEYGLSVITGVVLALAVGFGWRFYRQYTTTRAEKASIIYERVIVDLANNQAKDAAVQATRLKDKFKSTPYANLAAFALAKLAVSQQKLDDAVKQLKWVVAHNHNKVYKQLALIRLARIDAALGKSDEALKQLSSVVDKTFTSLIYEAKGDIYMQLGKKEQAKDAYQTALKTLPDDAANRPLVQMKLNEA